MTAIATITPTSSIAAPPYPTHPLGSRARVLLTSVFGPYAQDDEYGSRKINPMELYHNQVTRAQGPFSLRMFHRSWGLMLIQANIDAPSTLLDFPDLDRFIQEIATNEYDIVGISSIIPNVEKVRKMCRLVREHLPAVTVVVGGHVANAPDLHERIDADHNPVEYEKTKGHEDHSGRLRQAHGKDFLDRPPVHIRQFPVDHHLGLSPNEHAEDKDYG